MVDPYKLMEMPVAEEATAAEHIAALPAIEKTEKEKKPDYAKLVEEGKGIMMDGKYVSFDGTTDILIERDKVREVMASEQEEEPITGEEFGLSHPKDQLPRKSSGKVSAEDDEED